MKKIVLTTILTLLSFGVFAEEEKHHLIGCFYIENAPPFTGSVTIRQKDQKIVTPLYLNAFFLDYDLTIARCFNTGAVAETAGGIIDGDTPFTVTIKIDSMISLDTTDTDTFFEVMIMPVSITAFNEWSNSLTLLDTLANPSTYSLPATTTMSNLTYGLYIWDYGMDDASSESTFSLLDEWTMKTQAVIWQQGDKQYYPERTVTGAMIDTWRTESAAWRALMKIWRTCRIDPGCTPDDKPVKPVRPKNPASDLDEGHVVFDSVDFFNNDHPTSIHIRMRHFKDDDERSLPDNITTE